MKVVKENPAVTYFILVWVIAIWSDTSFNKILIAIGTNQKSEITAYAYICILWYFIFLSNTKAYLLTYSILLLSFSKVHTILILFSKVLYEVFVTMKRL